MPAAGCDPKALKIAQALHRAHQAEITILFGSRARGDYQDGRSDIDILLVKDNPPTGAQEILIEQEAESLAQAIYGRPVPVQTIWHSSAEFNRMRRTANHVVARALQEGAVMSRNPENHSSRRDPADNDHSYEWTVTEERRRHAEQHLAVFNMIADSGMDDMIGQQAHQALEHAMKALLSAHGRQYKLIHNLNELVGDVRRADPDFQFRLTIPGRIYNQYAGRDEYQPTKDPLTRLPGFAEATRSDVQRLLERVRAISGAPPDSLPSQ